MRFHAISEQFWDFWQLVWFQAPYMAFLKKVNCELWGRVFNFFFFLILDKAKKLYLAFSIEKNLSKIFDTRQSTKLSALSGMKAISAVHIVLAHCFFVEANGNIQNVKFAEVLFHNFSGKKYVCVHISVVYSWKQTWVVNNQ